MTRTEEIRARVEKATLAPWLWDGDDCDETQDEPHIYIPCKDAKVKGAITVLFQADWATKEDAEFAAEARSDVPYLLTELTALREEVGRTYVNNSGHLAGVSDRVDLAPIDVTGSGTGCSQMNAEEKLMRDAGWYVKGRDVYQVRNGHVLPAACPATDAEIALWRTALSYLAALSPSPAQQEPESA